MTLRKRSYLSELAYQGNLGAVEMFQFDWKATPEEQKLMDKLLKEKKWDEVLELLRKVTGTKLFPMGKKE